MPSRVGPLAPKILTAESTKETQKRLQPPRLAAAGRVQKEASFFRFLKNFLFSFVSKPDNLNKMQFVLRKRRT